MNLRLDNANPTIFKKKQDRVITAEEANEFITDKFDAREVFDLIRDIQDPEHPHTLEELNVVDESLIEVDDDKNSVRVYFTPTIPHCSQATLIGLTIQEKLNRSLPPRFKIDLCLTPGSHNSEDAINKQLADKERVVAALENKHLLGLVNQCLANSF